MMAVHTTVLLAALTGAVTCLFQRKHLELTTDFTWTEAQVFCRNHYVDLSTIDTPEELQKFRADTKGMSGKHWVGLRRDSISVGFTGWSDGSLLGNPRWKDGQPEDKANELCVFSDNAELSDMDCKNTEKFFCYMWEPQAIVVQEMKTWREALDYCRTFYTDLISLTSETDLLVIRNKSSEVKTPSFWTGLNFLDGSWFWVNNETLQNPESWLCYTPPFRCGAQETASGVFEIRDCEEKMNFICYSNTGR